MPLHSPHPVDIAVRFVAAQQGGAARLLAQHRPRDDERTCLGCGARWPCSVALIARRAALTHRDATPGG